MSRRLAKEGLGWGFLLWLIGYILGFILFMFVPKLLIGWIIMPIGIVITLWVLFKKVQAKEISHFLKLGVIWVLMAIVLDYLFVVKLLKPEDGYYKLDVYIYYLSALGLPLAVGWYRSKSRANVK